MYSRILLVITISIVGISLGGCESAQEKENREIAERMKLELLEKQTEENRIQREKQAQIDRLEAIEREKEREIEYAAAKKRDGISSQSQALSKCKRELRADTNSGEYMNYSAEDQRRMMTLQIDTCMYQYGYYGL